MVDVMLMLITDALRGFLEGGNLANKKNKVIVPEIRDLVERKIPEGGKAVFLGDSHSKGDPELQVLPEHCMAGTKEAEIVDELFEFVTLENYIPKNSFDAFFGTNLEEILKQENPQKVVVVGVCTDICVLFAVAGLRNRGYEVIVPKDCVRALDADNTDLWLNYLENVLGAQVVEKQEEI